MPAIELKDTTLFSDPALEAYYRMESGALTTDSSGDGETLTNNNTVGENSSGRFGGCADFGTANTNKYFSKATNLGIAGNGDASLACWLKIRTEIAAGVYGVMGVCSTTGAQRLLEFYYQYNAGTRRLSVNMAGVSLNYNITLGTANWYHIAVTRIGTAVKLYVNGAEVASGTNGTTNTDLNIAAIGADVAGTVFGSQFMDDIAYFSRGLSGAEILDLYQGGLGIPTTNYLTNYRPRKRTPGVVSV